MKTVAYIRVSSQAQDLDQQKLTLLDYAQNQQITIDAYLPVQMSATKSQQDRRINELIALLQPGDRLLVSELSRLGRSVGQIIRLVDTLLQKGVKVVAIKENMQLEGNQSLQHKVMVTMFGLFAEIERDLLADRTRNGLQAAKEKGRLIGRPKGSKGPSKLDGQEEEIQKLLDKGVSVASIAKIMEVARSTLQSFMHSRGLKRAKRPVS